MLRSTAFALAVYIQRWQSGVYVLRTNITGPGLKISEHTKHVLKTCHVLHSEIICDAPFCYMHVSKHTASNIILAEPLTRESTAVRPRPYILTRKWHKCHRIS